MRRLSTRLIVAISTLALAQMATAADMAVKAPPPAAPVCVWCGWYIGLNAGWVGSANNNITNTGTDTGDFGFGSLLTIFGAIPGSISDSLSGFIGGGQIGYNWQTGNVVAGVEADFDGASAKKTVNAVFPGTDVVFPITTIYRSQLDWLSTLRGRLGFMASPNVLLFVTGGLAVGEVKTANAATCPEFLPPCSAEATTANTNTSIRAGGTAGGGIEWMVAPHWSIKAEYLYASLGRTNSTITYNYPFLGVTTAVSSLTSSVRNNYNIARAGVNWHF
jgi:outer membrane immunogenic protein